MEYGDEAFRVYPRTRVHRLDEVNAQWLVDRSGLDGEERPLRRRRSARRHFDADRIDPVAALRRAWEVKPRRRCTTAPRGRRASRIEVDRELVVAVGRAFERKCPRGTERLLCRSGAGDDGSELGAIDDARIDRHSSARG